MINLNNITLICVDCLHHASAIKAINKSIENIEFGKVIFVTDKLLKSENFETVIIDRINSKEEYSKFMIFSLNTHVKTDYCLVIQYDGYVINPHLWRDEFLQYDYIGAPWWYKDKYNMGNGGFSLRSKKLLIACQKEKFQNYHPEDNAICRENRKKLENKYGLKYAPDPLAEKFSFEPNMLHPFFKNDTFGFHGVPNLIL